MAYTYHGTTELVKTGEVITVLPSGLIQKNLTFVGRKSEEREAAQTKVLSQLGNDFFAFPTLPSEVDLNNGFIDYKTKQLKCRPVMSILNTSGVNTQSTIRLTIQNYYEENRYTNSP